MSYVKKWGPIIFTPSDMVVTALDFLWAPEPDMKKHLDGQGNPTCFFAWSDPLRACKGFWLTADIPLLALIGDRDATAIKLLGFTYNKLAEWVGPTVRDTASFLCDLDGTRLIDIEVPNGIDKTQQFNQPLAGTNVRFGLFQYASTGGPYGWVDSHLWGYSVWGEYKTPSPPVARTVTVNVYDVAAASSIAEATVNLLSGITIVASAKTDANGKAVLTALDQNYLLRVYAVNHVPYPSEITVDLKPGNANVDVPLSFVAPPAPVLPWWVIPLAVGTGIVAIFIVLGKPRPPPIMVVR